MPDTCEGNKPFDQVIAAGREPAQETRRRERRCASTGPEHRRLRDTARSECGEILHGDGNYKASVRKKNTECLGRIAFLHVNVYGY